MNKKTGWIVAICSIFISILAHSFFLTEWRNGRYMVGPNDGLSQIVTFKKLLYEEFTQGNFFYSYSFGMGGGIFSQLGYYFTTSMFFILTVAVVFLLQSLSIIGQPDALFWAQSAVFISIGKLAFIIMTAWFAFYQLVKNKLAAFTGACIYGLSVIYFRHTGFWEFFTDAFLWVPLLVLGAERVIRERKPALLIVACSLTLINNFYFAYINLIFLFIYAVFRYVIKIDENEATLWEQLKLYTVSVILSFGISAFSFVTSVYGFLHNLRPAYDQKINWFALSDDILFSSRTIVLPAVFVLFLFIFSFYKNRTYLLFVSISGLLTFLHFSPMAASTFNGLSAPQYRFEYLLSFTIGGAVAAGMTMLSKVGKKSVLVAASIGLFIYLIARWIYILFDASEQDLKTDMVIYAIAIIAVFILYAFNKIRRFPVILQMAVILISIFTVNTYQEHTLWNVGDLYKVSKSYINSEEYDGDEQRQLINEIKDRDPDPFARIDWMTDTRNNTPIIQNFNGFSVYSSILNKDLLELYWYDLNIDIKRESVSRYAGLGDRTNLHSIFYGKYFIKGKNGKTGDVPYGFSKVLENKHYEAYENTNLLPFVRTENTAYSEDSLKNAPPLAREHAMLEGIVLENTDDEAKPPQVNNIIGDSELKTVDATYENGDLSVTGDQGGIDVIVPDQDANKAEDYYISFHLENKAADELYELRVNQYETSRKSNKSIYKTGVNQLTIRVPAQEKISIRLPKGEYKLEDLKLYAESYELLEEKKEESHPEARINWNKNKLNINLKNEKNDRFMVIPVPYEKGWEVTVNGKKEELEKANYSFIGIPIASGENNIELTYYPPFLKLTLAVSAVFLLLALFYCRRIKKLGS
ncbi:YfhO family protein [Bacillus gobiensis]|uniref:YfhO family protein n=1 Tax=Bacillus gobiensis TaxID=1441095 RepID=UPI003D1BA9D6